MSSQTSRTTSVFTLAAVAVCASLIGPARAQQVPTTLNDFFMPGSQPLEYNDQLKQANDCKGCHGEYDINREPYRPWAASMMGQATRDPMFHAALAIANQDAAFAGDLCLRCHTPPGWFEGRSTPTNGSALKEEDMEGVTCHTCHRMVDPDYKPGISPSADLTILNGLSAPPTTEQHSGMFVLDPDDRRRGPFNLGPNFGEHDWFESPFHRDSMMCMTCHDVSNPAYTYDPGTGAFVLNNIGSPHPTMDKLDMFPIERTASEWKMSDFALGPINMGGRFGGEKFEVSSCQDCHMPDATGQGCNTGVVRPDVPRHFFHGGNTWVLNAVRNLYGDDKTHLTTLSVTQAIARTIDFLNAASDMELSVQAADLNVRVINYSGHKLPTGYPEGRRMWINVRFLDTNNALLIEHGAYDLATAVLSAHDTKVYHAEMGVDAAVSTATGIPIGPSFHFAVNNTWYLDNRIPPMGFTNANFASVQAAPVGYTYADGQYWDDTLYPIPPGAARAIVRVFYQSVSKEYVEFLRDENRTNSAGQVLYDQWELLGKSEPIEIDYGVQELPIICYADCDQSTGVGVLDIFDFLCFQNRFVAGDPYACDCDTSTGPGVCDIFDFLCFQDAFVAGCP